MNVDVRHTLEMFRSKHRKSTFLYSLSSAFYGIPAVALMYNYTACLRALSGNVVLMNLMITQLFIQCPLSYLNDTYTLWKYTTFNKWHFWSYMDVSGACATFCTQIIMTPQLCETPFELLLYIVGLCVSIGFFVLGRIASQSKEFTTNRLHKWTWCVSHAMWHFTLPLSCTYVILV